MSSNQTIDFSTLHQELESGIIQYKTIETILASTDDQTVQDAVVSAVQTLSSPDDKAGLLLKILRGNHTVQPVKDSVAQSLLGSMNTFNPSEQGHVRSALFANTQDKAESA